MFGLGRLGDQFVGRRLVERELLFDDGVQLLALGIGDITVDGGGMDEQRHRREAIVVMREVGRMLVAFRHLGQKLAKARKHGAVP